MKKYFFIPCIIFLAACSSSTDSKIKDLIEKKEMAKGNTVSDITYLENIKNGEMGTIHYSAKMQEKSISDTITISITGDGMVSEIIN